MNSWVKGKEKALISDLCRCVCLIMDMEVKRDDE